MSKQGLKNLFARVIYDDMFRSSLIKDFDSAIHNSGFELENDEIKSLKDIDFEKVQIKVATIDAESVILL